MSLPEGFLAQLLELAEGNPGALQVLGAIMRNHPSELACVMSALQTRGIRGSDIWVVYKRQCDQDIGAFIARVTC